MKSLLLLLLFFNLSSAYALLEFDDGANPEIINSARALAMGNAFMSKVDDSWSSFYNPAGLGTVRGVQFHLANAQLELNNGFMDVTSGKGSISDVFSKYSEALKAKGMRNQLEKNPGTSTHARIQFFPNVTVRGFTLGYVYAKQNMARLLKSNSDYEIAERTDYGPVASLSFSLFGGILKFGASAIHLTRKEMQKDFEASEPTKIDESEDYKKGSMTLITAGTRLTLPFVFLPTFSFVMRNTSSADWDSPDFSGTPSKIPHTTDAGFSITPIFGKVFRMHIEVNQKDLQNRYSDVSNRRKFLGGIEFDYKRKMFVRFGFGDGWGSAGVGVRNESFIFDLTTYGVELSDHYREKEDRRWVLSLSSGF